MNKNNNDISINKIFLIYLVLILSSHLTYTHISIHIITRSLHGSSQSIFGWKISFNSSSSHLPSSSSQTIQKTIKNYILHLWLYAICNTEMTKISQYYRKSKSQVSPAINNFTPDSDKHTLFSIAFILLGLVKSERIKFTLGGKEWWRDINLSIYLDRDDSRSFVVTNFKRIKILIFKECRLIVDRLCCSFIYHNTLLWIHPTPTIHKPQLLFVYFSFFHSSIYLTLIMIFLENIFSLFFFFKWKFINIFIPSSALSRFSFIFSYFSSSWYF